ncbi:MAG: glutathione S-transferase family protein [Rhodospirillales bacterium]|nr:glutathione S-transferase family protein [Rhodospirillales bacterium]
MSRYKLYAAKGSGAFPVAVMLAAAGVPYDSEWLSLAAQDQHRAGFLAVNPRGQIPALLLPDGQVMTESAAICLYLADRHPESGLFPRPQSAGRAKALRWLIFAATQLYEDDLRIYYPQRYTGDPAGAPAVKAAAAAAFERHLDMVEAAIGTGPFLLGGTLSIVDAYLTMLAGWHPRAGAAGKRFPRLALLAEAVLADPRIAPHWTDFEMNEI